MGLFGGGGAAVRRYRLKERAFDVGEDYWVEDEAGDRAFEIDGKALRIRRTFILKDASGTELATIKGKLVGFRKRMFIERGGRTGTVSKALLGIRARYDIDLEDGPNLRARGNFTHHDYEIEQEGRVVARISKKWFRIRDSYGIEVVEGADVPLAIAIAVCIDELAHD